MDNITQATQPELLMGEWLASVFMLITLSLLFYHMTQLKTLNMGRGYASLYSVVLIVCAIVLLWTSLMSYLERSRFAISRIEDPYSHGKETVTRNVYKTVCGTIGVVVICIAATILRGVLPIQD